MHHEKSNHTWFGGFRFRLDAGVLCQRAFGDEHHNAPDYGFNAGTYRGFNAGAPAVVYSAEQSRNYQPWLLIRLQCCSIAGRSTEAGGVTPQHGRVL
jgi:hypothetical protein